MMKIVIILLASGFPSWAARGSIVIQVKENQIGKRKEEEREKEVKRKL